MMKNNAALQSWNVGAPIRRPHFRPLVLSDKLAHDGIGLLLYSYVSALPYSYIAIIGDQENAITRRGSMNMGYCSAQFFCP